MANRQARYKVGDVIGDTLHQFRVYEVHMGGMGEVYLCLHEKNKYPYALKTFQGADSRMKKLFEEETRTWIELGIHPNIVRCHAMNIYDNTPFIMLEWILGEEGYGTDLRSWIRKGSLDLKQSLKFAIDIVRGLAYAGEKSDNRIVHRDLKPDNVLVARGGMAKITDFGLAIIKSNLSDNTGGGAGTYAYMSPEQWRTDIHLDVRADIYAVGCILYEMLTGQMPYIASTKKQMRLQHLETPIPNVNNMPVEVNTVINKCMAKNRDERYPTVQALLDMLMVAYQVHTGETLPDVQEGEMDEVDYVNRGITYANLGEYDRAITEYDRAIRLNPNFVHAYYNRGTSHMRNGMVDRAIADYTEAIRLNPNFAEAYYSRGVSYQNKRMDDFAIADYTEAIRLNPIYTNAYMNRGVIYGKKGMDNCAIADYDEVIRLNPTYTNAYTNRGNSYAGLEQHGQAIANFDKAIHLNPNDAEVYYNRGNSYDELGQPAQAIADYDEAIRLNPTLAQVYNNRGLIYLGLGQHGQAIANFDEAIRLNPAYATAWFNKGSLYGRMRRLPEALTCFEKAHQLGYPGVLGIIQQVKRDMGGANSPNDPQVAFEAFQRATSLEAMRQAVAQYPILKEIIPHIQHIIQTQVRPEHKPEFETRLAWLVQIAKGD